VVPPPCRPLVGDTSTICNSAKQCSASGRLRAPNQRDRHLAINVHISTLMTQRAKRGSFGCRHWADTALPSTVAPFHAPTLCCTPDNQRQSSFEAMAAPSARHFSSRRRRRRSGTRRPVGVGGLDPLEPGDQHQQRRGRASGICQQHVASPEAVGGRMSNQVSHLRRAGPRHSLRRRSR